MIPKQYELLSSFWGGQFGPFLGGQFGPVQVVNLNRRSVVNLTDFCTMIKEWKSDSVPLPILDSTHLEWLRDFEAEHELIPSIGYALLGINDTLFEINDPVFITDTSSNVPTEPMQILSVESRLFKEKRTIAYPNPAQNLVTIEWIYKNTESKNCSVVVYDILGKEVLSNEWKSNQKALKLDVSPLKIGFYYFTIYIDSIPFDVHKIQLSK